MAGLGRLRKFTPPGPVADIAAKLPPKRKYGFRVANDRFSLFGVRSEWPLCCDASGRNGSIAAGECRLPGQVKTENSWRISVRLNA
jgi:hypothetical protein